MSSRPAREDPWNWIATGAWVGLALAVARLLLVFAMDHWVRGLDAAMTRWRVAERATGALAVGITVGIVCAWMLRARRTSWTRHARTALAAAAMGAVLAGWPFDDAYHVPGPGSSRGVATLAALAVAASVLALWLARRSASASARARARKGEPGGGEPGGDRSREDRSREQDARDRATRDPRRGVGPASALAAVVLALTIGIAARLTIRDPGSSMVVREVLRNLSLDVGLWEIEHARPAAPPRSASVTPNLLIRLDSGELPALVMPPPCRVSYVVGADEDGLRLRASAGCDLTVPGAFSSRDEAPTIVFRILVDGRSVLETRRTPWVGESEGASGWTRLAGGSGIDVPAGCRITLETAFEGAEPTPEVAARAAEVGFGELLLERDFERPRTRATKERPNVVLVVMDTLRADRTSLHGYARPTTPVLESLAARGTTFDQAFTTSSWTLPSTTSILTGLDPAAHGVISDTECYLSDEIETLPEVLQREGFTTGAFSCNPLVGPTRNFDSGFETFEFTPGAFLMSEQVMPSVLSWIDGHASVRFFLYLHLVDPHELHRSRAEDRRRFAGPIPADMDEHALHDYSGRLLAGQGRAPDGSWEPGRVVPAEHLRWLSDAYDAAIATGDHALGQVLERLDALSLRDDTLVVFTSDHGEELLEHGHLQHGQALHTELVHVPLVIAGPGVAAGVRRAEPVSNRHVAETLARVGGTRLGAQGAVDLREITAPEPIFMATESGWWNGERLASVRALRADGWSLHVRLGDDGSAELYDLGDDPGELVDVSALHPDRVAEMRQRVAEHERAHSALRPRTVRAGAGTRELLRATGYAGDER